MLLVPVLFLFFKKNAKLINQKQQHQQQQCQGLDADWKRQNLTQLFSRHANIAS